MKFINITSLSLMILCFTCSLLTWHSAGQECGPDSVCPDDLCCSIWGWCGWSKKYCAPAYCQSQCDPDAAAAAAATSIITRQIFDEIITLPAKSLCPNNTAGGNHFYTYDSFVAAAGAFPGGFGTTGTIEDRKRELAAFFAQTSHQTTGYCFVSEMKGGENCAQSHKWPCFPGQQYYGRGPIQLTYNYNYGPAGRAIGVDLLAKPDLVATNATISFQTAMWFWMTPRDNNVPSCHDAIIGAWTPTPADVAANRLPGYGVVTNIINGGLECGRGGADREIRRKRVGFYLRFCEILDVSPGDNLDCNNQIPFGFSLKKNRYLKSPYEALKMSV